MMVNIKLALCEAHVTNIGEHTVVFFYTELLQTVDMNHKKTAWSRTCVIVWYEWVYHGSQCHTVQRLTNLVCSPCNSFIIILIIVSTNVHTARRLLVQSQLVFGIVLFHTFYLMLIQFCTGTFFLYTFKTILHKFVCVYFVKCVLVVPFVLYWSMFVWLWRTYCRLVNQAQIHSWNKRG